MNLGGWGLWITNIQSIIEVYFLEKKRLHIQNDFSVSNVGYSVLIYLFYAFLPIFSYIENLGDLMCT